MYELHPYETPFTAGLRTVFETRPLPQAEIQMLPLNLEAFRPMSLLQIPLLEGGRELGAKQDLGYPRKRTRQRTTS